jgi:hypothetical protein
LPSSSPTTIIFHHVSAILLLHIYAALPTSEWPFSYDGPPPPTFFHIPPTQERVSDSLINLEIALREFYPPYFRQVEDGSASNVPLLFRAQTQVKGHL